MSDNVKEIAARVEPPAVGWTPSMEDIAEQTKKVLSDPWLHAFFNWSCSAAREAGKLMAPAPPTPQPERAVPVEVRNLASAVSELLSMVDAETGGEISGYFMLWRSATVLEKLRERVRAVARLASAPAEPQESKDRFDCAACGRGVKVDEDGCCAHCGQDAIGVEDNEYQLPAAPQASEEVRGAWAEAESHLRNNQRKLSDGTVEGDYYADQLEHVIAILRRALRIGEGR